MSSRARSWPAVAMRPVFTVATLHSGPMLLKTVEFRVTVAQATRLVLVVLGRAMLPSSNLTVFNLAREAPG